MSEPSDYMIGWICALSIEYVAARTFLDEVHPGPRVVSTHDQNNYTLGRVGGHNVVLAVLPDGEYGVASAAGVARDMLHTFPNIRIGLMVGIGGGAPSQSNDMRLGDVIVSSARDGRGSVLQYDLAKTCQKQSFQPTGYHLNQSPTVLRTAVNGLKAQYEMDGHQLDAAINSVLRKRPRLQKKYGRPDQSTDRLFRSDITHPPDNDDKCTAVCSHNPSHMIQRHERSQDEDDPAIHYGLIASADQLMDDAVLRDRLAAEQGVLCFESEAAGLMNHFPCLVVRGVCDYADSHKNAEWQGYAAMAAAAYAKDLLCVIPSNKVEAEKPIVQLLLGLETLAKEHLDLAAEQLRVQKDVFKQRLSEKEQECHQLFRLTTGGRDITYEWYKNRVEDRVEGTCLWFLRHEHFQAWLKQASGPLLVSADPGCGKSVLAKYLVDQGLPKSETAICYFFFKDQDQNTIRQALCALLHQLFSHKPSLIAHAMARFRKDGRGMINSTAALWEIYYDVIRDPQTGPVIVVLDALDECGESEFADLMWNLQNQFRELAGSSQLKYLLTSRPYEQVMSRFRSLLALFPKVHIPGEDESDIISQEVNLVIRHKVAGLSRKKRLSPAIQRLIEERLQQITNRTYLWVHLVFDYLEREDFKRTLQGIRAILSVLPQSVNQAYEHILSRSKDDPMVRKALSIVLAGGRPLTLTEMNLAVNIDYTTRSICDLDLEDDEDFKLRLRSWCGLFVSVHCNNVYFIHQTAREFLLTDLASPAIFKPDLRLSWQGSILLQHAHAILAMICVLFLNFYNNSDSDDHGSPTDMDMDVDTRYDVAFDGDGLLHYAAKYWVTHFQQANVADSDAIIPYALNICDPHSKSYGKWNDTFWESTGFFDLPSPTTFMVASHCGLYPIVKGMLESGADVEARDAFNRQTPLFWAAVGGHEAVISLLLEHDADINARDASDQTPLSWASGRGHTAAVKLLLAKGSDVEARDSKGKTPLLLAVEKGHVDVIKLLLRSGAKVNVKDASGWTPLMTAVDRENLVVVASLLEKQSIDLEARSMKHTPLLWAVQKGHQGIVKRLLKKGANIEAKSQAGHSPILFAAARGDAPMVRILIEHGADIHASDGEAPAPLWLAARADKLSVVELLVDQGADINCKAQYDYTPLIAAALYGGEATVKLLLKKGADENAKDTDGQTALSWACKGGHLAVVQHLLQGSANVNDQDNSGRTPLLWAVTNGHHRVLERLLAHGADVNVRDAAGWTPLLWAVRRGHEYMVEQLLRCKGNAVTDVQDAAGRTPLLWAAKRGEEGIVRRLLESGADVGIKDQGGQTALGWAVKRRDEGIAKALVEGGAIVEHS